MMVAGRNPPSRWSCSRAFGACWISSNVSGVLIRTPLCRLVSSQREHPENTKGLKSGRLPTEGVGGLMSRRTLYRGDPGMWSWVLHRITGAAISSSSLSTSSTPLWSGSARRPPQRGRRNLQDADRRTHGDGARRRGALSRAQRVRLILIDFWVKARDTSGRCCGPSPRCGSWSWFRPSWLWAPMAERFL